MVQIPDLTRRTVTITSEGKGDAEITGMVVRQTEFGIAIERGGTRHWKFMAGIHAGIHTIVDTATGTEIYRNNAVAGAYGKALFDQKERRAEIRRAGEYSEVALE